MTIGERIKNAREVAGMTQVELGERVGVSGVAIMRYEKDARQPRLEQLRQIALALGTTVSELVEPEYWSNLSPEEWDSVRKPGPKAKAHTAARTRITAALGKLNEAGMEKAAEAVEIIAEVPRYRASQAVQQGGQRPSPAPEGMDTTSPPDGSEEPPEGK